MTRKRCLLAPVVGFRDNVFVSREQPVVLTHDPAALWPSGRQLHPRVREKGCHNGNMQYTSQSHWEGERTIRAGVVKTRSNTPQELRVSGYRIYNLSAGKVSIDATSCRGESGLGARLCWTLVLVIRQSAHALSSRAHGWWVNYNLCFNRQKCFIKHQKWQQLNVETCKLTSQLTWFSIKHFYLKLQIVLALFVALFVLLS